MLCFVKVLVSHLIREYELFSKWYLKEFMYVVQDSLTYEKISEKMLKMKVIQNFVVNNFYIIHFNDKVCWTSQILGENSWKIVTFFCCEFCFRRRRRGADDQCIKTNNKMSHFFQDFSPRICEVQQGFSLISCCKMLFRIFMKVLHFSILNNI